MRRTVLGTSIIAALLVVISLTSGFAPTRQVRPQPSDFGVEVSEEAPFEIGTVLDSQSFR